MNAKKQDLYHIAMFSFGISSSIAPPKCLVVCTLQRDCWQFWQTWRSRSPKTKLFQNRQDFVLTSLRDFLHLQCIKMVTLIVSYCHKVKLHILRFWLFFFLSSYVLGAVCVFYTFLKLNIHNTYLYIWISEYGIIWSCCVFNSCTVLPKLP